MTNARNSLDERDGWGINPTDQLTVAVITTIALAVIAASWIYRGGLSGRMIDVETAEPREVSFQLDINTAEWPEWTLLPGVGKKLAKRIVQNRDERGLFRSHDDLLRVSGIGPRTMGRMLPYLLPLAERNPAPEEDVAAHQ